MLNGASRTKILHVDAYENLSLLQDTSNLELRKSRTRTDLKLSQATGRHCAAPPPRRAPPDVCARGSPAPERRTCRRRASRNIRAAGAQSGVAAARWLTAPLPRRAPLSASASLRRSAGAGPRQTGRGPGTGSGSLASAEAAARYSSEDIFKVKCYEQDPAKGKKKGRGKSRGKKQKKPEVDILSPAAMLNLYYIAHNVADCLQLRGFRWPGAAKTKKGKGKT
ncbi:hypothetical protein E5288_WYG007246 [Bos mutus]|uniref:Small lysine-rich protein 1 n=1 Tax=Bos mutus TaxID=72004 RepID=A0A6B0SHS0_9CETA|nr:hypothetical protein [Bos mutus]